MPLEIQTFTLADGWTNTWTYEDDDGVARREFFATTDEAEAALAEHLDDLREAYWEGQIADYDHNDYRIRYVADASTTITTNQGERT
jgi:hypothetical protein